mgnify:CR=1 FL=1
MTDFNFTYDGSDDSKSDNKLTIDKSPLDTADDDDESVATFKNGNIVVDISDDYASHLNILADLRYATGSGMPQSERQYDDSAQGDVKDSSMAGEGGLHIAYDEWVLDEEIYENGGDDGIDGFLEIDGELVSADVKCPTSQYGSDPWLKVMAQKIERERRHGGVGADVFILASYNDGTVTYHGWISAERLCRKENRSDKTGTDNYLITDTSKLNDMPPITFPSQSLTTNDSGFSITQEAGD